MKRAVRLAALIAIAAVVLMGCGKAPVEEMNSAKAEIDAVMAAGVQKYAPEVSQKLSADLGAAMEEVKTQDGKLLKNYDKAKGMLVALKGEASEAKAVVAQKKEEARLAALAAKDAADAAVQAASELMAKAPTGKGTTEDLEAMKADVKGLEESLPDVQALLDGENYLEASDRAGAIKAKADEISAQISEAIERVKMARKGKRK